MKRLIDYLTNLPTSTVNRVIGGIVSFLLTLSVVVAVMFAGHYLTGRVPDTFEILAIVYLIWLCFIRGKVVIE